MKNLDAALLKSFALNERMRGEFRFELQNATNTVTWGRPASSFGSTNFGVISGYASGRGAREVQLGFKFYF